MIKSHYETVRKAVGDTVQLCIVTKYRSDEEILSYYDAGERIFGENRVQELREKAARLPGDIRWQMIGHLQKNKVKDVVGLVDCIQSLDSQALAKLIEKEAAKKDITVNVLLEAHLAEEDTNKTGMSPDDVMDLLAKADDFPHLRIRGLMAMGPLTDDTERIREVFTRAHDLFTRMQEARGSDQIDTLSLGMSDDYPIAIECGSNMIRVGTYLFKE